MVLVSSFKLPITTTGMPNSAITCRHAPQGEHSREAGSEAPNFTYIPALGAADSIIGVLANLIMAKGA